VEHSAIYKSDVIKALRAFEEYFEVPARQD
jgi:hypothetical protein